MQPHSFISKWRSVELKERSASQSHFNDLCAVLGQPNPISADPTGEFFAFEKGALKTGGGDGWADVWKRGCFAWEYKGKRKNLDDAYVQLQRYAVALENPPLLIVSDMDRFRIHTNWTNTVQQVYELHLDDIADEKNLRILRNAFSEAEVEQLKPGKTRQELTEDVAGKFAGIAKNLRDRGHKADIVAHYVNRMIFCMFAEDVGLLPNHMFRRMLEASKTNPGSFLDNARQLFSAMRNGGNVGFERVDWFNGGIFDDDTVLELTDLEVQEALEAAQLDWSNIDPSIMGTLFERGLDPDKRSQLGAHYTDRDKIMLIINPTIVEPLKAEWKETKAQINKLIERRDTHKDRGQRTRAYNDAVALHQAYIERLKTFRILDPACGSGNFLHLALHALKDLEHRANLEAEQLGLPFIFPSVGPEAVLGIEINPYAAELARVSVWIGEIQWMLQHGFAVARQPILKPLNSIECRDALLNNEDGTKAMWPEADVIVGNPPFLGNKRMIEVLSEDYTTDLRSAYAQDFSSGIDLVSYWIGKALDQIEQQKALKAGFVATQSVRRGADADILRDIVAAGRIFNAWDDEPWVVDGAEVRVSLLCFDLESEGDCQLDGENVVSIAADLSTGTDLTSAQTLIENKQVSFQGTIKVGAFDITANDARAWLRRPNPNGKSNSLVLAPWRNGSDITGRPNDKWIIDFGVDMKADEAALFELPYGHVLANVKPHRDKVRRQGHRERWWIFGEARPALRRSIEDLDRFIVTPRVAKYRLFSWLPKGTVPDARLVVISRSDDTTFGILHSRLHELWTLRLGGWHGVGNDPQYTPSLGFETFPFPEDLTPNIPSSDYADNPRSQAIASAAKQLNELRENWLNPQEWVKRVPEVVPGYPDRLIPVDEAAEEELKTRTLTNLYNERPTWLANAHRDLDAAVAAAYGWPADLNDDEILRRLFDLNQDRAGAGR